MTTKDAVKKLVKSLKEDEGYRISWQANIAMAFVDEFERTYSDNHFFKRPSDEYRRYIHKVANDAADNFLNLLCRDTEN